MLDSKYNIPSEPEFMSAPIEFEIPKYEDQGQTRGRKPKAESKKGSGKGKTRSKKVTKDGKMKRRGKGKGKAKKVIKGNKAKIQRVKRALQSASAASASSCPASRPARKTRKVRNAHGIDHPAPEASRDSEASPAVPEAIPEAVPEAIPAASAAAEEDWEIPKDTIKAPEHVTYNGVYSTAYRRAKGVDAKMKGQHASWLLRVHGLISPSLSGIPREPKANKIEVAGKKAAKTA